jgi:hypothetical protein
MTDICRDDDDEDTVVSMMMNIVQIVMMAIVQIMMDGGHCDDDDGQCAYKDEGHCVNYYRQHIIDDVNRTDDDRNIDDE